MNIRDQIIAEAETWLATPYKHMARVKGAGVDCAMLLVEVYQAVGLLPRDFEIAFYPPDWHFHRGEERYLANVRAQAIKIETPERGDVAMFKFGRCVSHAAIVVEWPVVIHAYFRHGCIYAEGNNGELAGRVDSFWSLVR